MEKCSIYGEQLAILFCYCTLTHRYTLTIAIFVVFLQAFLRTFLRVSTRAIKVCRILMRADLTPLICGNPRLPQKHLRKDLSLPSQARQLRRRRQLSPPLLPLEAYSTSNRRRNYVQFCLLSSMAPPISPRRLLETDSKQIPLLRFC